MEKRDLSENLIDETPNLRVSGVRFQVSGGQHRAWSIEHRAWNKESGVRSQNPGGFLLLFLLQRTTDH